MQSMVLSDELIHTRKKPVNAFLLVSFLSVLLLGQPNGLYLLFPAVNFLLAVYIVALALVLIIFRRTLKIQVVYFSAVVFVFLAYSFLSLGYAPDPVFGLRVFTSVVFKVLSFLVIVSLINSIGDLKVALKTLCYASVFFSIGGIVLTFAILFFNLQPHTQVGEVSISNTLTYDQSLSYYSLLGFVRSSHDFMDLVYPRLESYFIEPGYFSFFLELTVFSTIALMTLEPWRKRRYRWALGIQFLALLMSLSLGGIICILLGYFLLYNFRRGGSLVVNSFRVLGRGILVAVGVALVIWALFPTFSEALWKVVVLDRFHVEYGNSSAETRQDAFGLGVKLWKSSPILGIGFNQVRVLGDGDGTNNSFLTVLAEGGIIGLAIYLVMSFFILWRAARNVSLARRALPFFTPAAAAISVGLFSMTMHCVLMDTNWTFLYWMSIALVFGCYKLCLNGNGPD